jgi:gliding motility-associated-like protein
MTVGTNVYHWTITDGICSASANDTVHYTPVNANAGFAQNVCGNTTTLAGTLPAGATGIWTVVSGAGIFVNNTSPTTQVNGLGTGPNVFQWFVTNGICSDSDTVRVTSVTNVTANAGSSQNVCKDSASLAATVPAGYAGTWTVTTGTGTFSSVTNPSASVSGMTPGPNVFTWTITNGICTGTDTVTIFFEPPLANAGSTQIICANSTSLSATLPVGYTGIWTLVSGSGVFVSPTNPNSTLNSIGIGTNVYQWTITNGTCSDSDTVSVTTSVPVAAFAGTDSITCQNFSTLAASLPTGYAGTWSVVSGTGSFTNSTNPNTQVNGLSPGLNSFVWTIVSGPCTASDTVTRFFTSIQVNPGKNVSVCGDSTFLAAVLDSGFTGVWTLLSGTGIFANDTSPVTLVSGLTNNVNNVFMWHVSNGTCADSARVSILRNDDDCIDTLELPTGFSPNGDELNPAYVIHGIDKYPYNTFKVFNRWGNEVYSKENYRNLPFNQADWYGQNNDGKDLPEGTYFVILIIKNSDIRKNTYVDLRR